MRTQAAEDDGVVGQAAAVHDEGPAQGVLQGVDAGLQHALVFAGGVVLGVLAQVAQLAGGGDALGHLDHLDVLHPIQVGLLLLVAFPGHGDSFVGHGVHVLNTTVPAGARKFGCRRFRRITQCNRGADAPRVPSHPEKATSSWLASAGL